MMSTFLGLSGAQSRRSSDCSLSPHRDADAAADILDQLLVLERDEEDEYSLLDGTLVGVRLPAAHCPLPAICSHRVTTARHIIAHQNVGKDVHLFGPCSGYWVMGHVFKTTVLGVAIDAPPPMEIDSLHRAPIRVEGMLRSEGLLD